MGRPPISDAERDRIIELARQGMARNDIARETGRAAATVTKIAHNAGLSFDRSMTEKAVKARQIDLAERRTELRDLYLIKAKQLLDQIDEPHLAFNIGGKDNTYTEHMLDKPTTGDIRNLMQSASIATTAEIRIGQAENDGDGAARSLILGLANAFGLVDQAADGDDAGT